MRHAVIGIDVGGTKIAAAVITLEGVCLKRLKTNTDDASDQLILAQVAGLIAKLLKYSSTAKVKILGIGVGVPGTVDSELGIANTSTNLPWHDTEICGPLQTRFNLPICLENDANAAALGEYYFGIARKIQSFVFISLGTGIGGGVVLGGRLLHAKGQGEIGHIIVDPQGPLCSCGDRGCIEAIASGLALGNNLRYALGSQDTNIDGEYVLNAATKGEAAALTIVKNAMRALAQGLVAIDRVISPELFVLGGGIMRAAKLLLPLIKDEVTAFGSSSATIGERLICSGLSEAAGEYGAAALSLDHIRRGGVASESM